MNRFAVKLVVRDVMIAIAIAALTLVVARSATAGIYGVKCTLYDAPCNVSGCCEGLYTEYRTSTPSGQTLSAAPVTPATQCAVQFENYLYFCKCCTQTGLCGGAATTAACD